MRDTVGGPSGEGERRREGAGLGGPWTGLEFEVNSSEAGFRAVSSSSSSSSSSGRSLIRMMSFDLFLLLYTSGSEGSRRTRGRAFLSSLFAFLLAFSVFSGSGAFGVVITGERASAGCRVSRLAIAFGVGAAGRAASTVTSVRISRWSRASTTVVGADGMGSGGEVGGEVTPALLILAISRMCSATAAAHASGSVSMGLGPQNDVSSSMRCGLGERDTPETTDRRDTLEIADCAEQADPTLDSRDVRPDTPSRAASEL